MAQTISELEKERAKLLEAIEAQADQISTGRKGNEAKPHRLNDWLNAAEQVLPEREPSPVLSSPRSRSSKGASKPVAQSSPPRQPMNTASNKASFFGVIIMLSLLVTILGVLYIVYNSLQNDLNQIRFAHNETLESVDRLQEDLATLVRTVEEGGDSEAFAEITARIDRFEQELNGLKHLQQSRESGPAVTQNTLQNVTQRLESEMNSRIQSLVTQMNQAGLSVDKNSLTESIHFDDTPKIAEPTPPSPPVLEQRVVRLVEPKTTPEVKEVKVAEQPLPADVAWIQRQNAEAFTLQLASMPTEEAIAQIKNQHNLSDARIVPQHRDGRLNYVLISGAFAERSQANQASEQIKNATGISPWIRRIRDVSANVTP